MRNDSLHLYTTPGARHFRLDGEALVARLIHPTEARRHARHASDDPRQRAGAGAAPKRRGLAGTRRNAGSGRSGSAIIEAYLARSPDIHDLERRMRNSSATAGIRY